MKTFISDISHTEFPENEKVNANIIRHSIFELIQKEYPNFNEHNNISISELNQFRHKYVADYLVKEMGDLSILEKNVLKTIENEETISKNMNGKLEYSNLQKVSDWQIK